MISVSVKKIASLIDGVIHKINNQLTDDLLIDNVILNSSHYSTNSLFIALKGRFFDGHDFIVDAIEHGSIALIVDHPIAVPCLQIIVKDTRIAMKKLATWVRIQNDVKIIGIAGSCGKTSVKELVVAILSTRGLTVCTEKNRNNDFGVASTIFKLTLKHKYAVIEMGTNKFNELKNISIFVKPDSLLINNLFPAHLEGLNSLEGVAKAKGESLLGLVKNGTAIINLLSNDLENWKSNYIKPEQKIQYFSINKMQNSDFYAENILTKTTGTEFELHTPIGVVTVCFPLYGLHNISNVLAASALSISVGATLENIRIGLSTVQPLLGRLYPIHLAPGKLLLDDTYNANSGSMIAGINVLSQIPGYRILIVNDMVELGSNSQQCHKDVGYAAKQMKIDKVFSVGNDSSIISKYSGCGKHFSSKRNLIKELIPLINKHNKVSILVKGSKVTEMEEVVDAIQEEFSC